MALEKELETFQKELPNLLQKEEYRDKYALVYGENVDSVWPTRDETMNAGYERFGLQPFLVKLITEHEKPRFFSRNIS